jgi:hypothetical protein
MVSRPRVLPLSEFNELYSRVASDCNFSTEEGFRNLGAFEAQLIANVRVGKTDGLYGLAQGIYFMRLFAINGDDVDAAWQWYQKDQANYVS